MNLANLLLTGVAVASVLATIAASFYGVRSKTIIQTLRESNDAYKERNAQLETELLRLHTEYETKLKELEARIKSLERIKTPPLEPLIKLIGNNHKEVMDVLNKGALK